jgi:hypothetical protein
MQAGTAKVRRFHPWNSHKSIRNEVRTSFVQHHRKAVLSNKDLFIYH